MRTKDKEHSQIIGERIKTLRQKKNISQHAFAKKLDITPQAVSRWECGLSLPDSSRLPAIAKALGVTINEIFEEKN